MPKQHVTKTKVFLAAKELAATGVMPTIVKIREQLKGKGSDTTIHRYLTDWKEQYLKLACQTLDVTAINLEKNKQYDEIYKENNQLKINLAKQQEQCQILANELAKTEKLKLELGNKYTLLEQENIQLKELTTNLSVEKDKFQGLYQEISLERELAIEKILTDKNALIESLRQELANINASSIKQIKDLSFGINDNLIQEKVKVINLQEKVAVLTKQIQELRLELQTARHKPL
jgi:hypothetical protein